MKRLGMISLIFIINQAALATQEQSINEFCSSKEDVNDCLRDYDGLPELKKLPFIPTNNPLPIKVIPYKNNIMIIEE